MRPAQHVLLGFTLPLFVAPSLLPGCGSDDEAGSSATTSSAATTTSGTGGSSSDATTTTSGTGGAGGGAGGAGGGSGGGGGAASGCMDGTQPPCYLEPIGLDAGGLVSALAISDWNGGGADVIVGRGGEVLYFASPADAPLPSAQAIAVTGIMGTVNDLEAGNLDVGPNLDIVVSSSATHAHVVFGDGSGAIANEQGTLDGEGQPFDIDLGDLEGSPASLDILELQSTNGCSAVTLTSGTEGAAFVSDGYQLCYGAYGVINRCSNAYSCATWVDADTPSMLVSQELYANGGTLGAGINTTTSLEANGARIASGIFDADIYEDVAVIVAGDKVNVLFGDGEAGWVDQGGVAYVSYTVGSEPSDLAVGDLDGDGDLDIAVANAGDDTLTLLHNDGAGAFSASVLTLPAGAAPSRIAVGDLNGDGTADIVLATSAPSDVTVLLYQP